jgi:hypothetical protein
VTNTDLAPPPVAPPGLALTLPRAAALTDALLAPVGPTVPAPELERLRRRVVRALPATTAGGSGRFELDAYRLDTALFDPSRCATDEPFTPSAARCRRAIGLDAVRRCLGDDRPPPATAVAEVLAAAVRAVELPDAGGGTVPWWAPWYTSSSSGARAVVQAEAVTWATALWTALDWERFVRVDVGGTRLRWVSPGPTGGVVLRARAEVRSWVGHAPVLLLARGGAPSGDWRPGLGFPALVAALAHDQRAVPRRVVGWWPAAGQVRIAEVDAGLLDVSADAVATAMAVWSASLPG